MKIGKKKILIWKIIEAKTIREAIKSYNHNMTKVAKA